MLIVVFLIVNTASSKKSYGPKNTYEEAPAPGKVEGPKETYEEAPAIQPGVVEGPKETYEEAPAPGKVDGPKETYEEAPAIQPGVVKGPKETYEEGPKDTYAEAEMQGGKADMGPKDTYNEKTPKESYGSNEELDSLLNDVQGGKYDEEVTKPEVPKKPATYKPEPKLYTGKWEPCNYGDTKGLVGMEQKDPQCDNLENWADWDGNEDAFTCTAEERKEHKMIRKELKDRAYFHLTYDLDCKHFQARHYCACEAIGPHNNPTYHSHIPTCHDHRPVWAQFGEYR